jgi:hypothetical protein
MSARRRLLPKLAVRAWKTLTSFLSEDTGGNALPAAIVSLQTAGEFLNWHPHLHVLAPAGAFRTDGSFIPSPVFDAAGLRYRLPSETRIAVCLIPGPGFVLWPDEDYGGK